jgi:hypothetical protein
LTGSGEVWKTKVLIKKALSLNQTINNRLGDQVNVVIKRTLARGRSLQYDILTNHKIYLTIEQNDELST